MCQYILNMTGIKNNNKKKEILYRIKKKTQSRHQVFKIEEGEGRERKWCGYRYITPLTLAFSSSFLFVILISFKKKQHIFHHKQMCLCNLLLNVTIFPPLILKTHRKKPTTRRRNNKLLQFWLNFHLICSTKKKWKMEKL